MRNKNLHTVLIGDLLNSTDMEKRLFAIDHAENPHTLKGFLSLDSDRREFKGALQNLISNDELSDTEASACYDMLLENRRNFTYFNASVKELCKIPSIAEKRLFKESDWGLVTTMIETLGDKISTEDRERLSGIGHEKINEALIENGIYPINEDVLNLNETEIVKLVNNTIKNTDIPSDLLKKIGDISDETKAACMKHLFNPNDYIFTKNKTVATAAIKRSAELGFLSNKMAKLGVDKELSSKEPDHDLLSELANHVFHEGLLYFGSEEMAHKTLNAELNANAGDLDNLKGRLREAYQGAKKKLNDHVPNDVMAGGGQEGKYNRDHAIAAVKGALSLSLEKNALDSDEIASLSQMGEKAKILIAKSGHGSPEYTSENHAIASNHIYGKRDFGLTSEEMMFLASSSDNSILQLNFCNNFKDSPRVVDRIFVALCSNDAAENYMECDKNAYVRAAREFTKNHGDEDDYISKLQASDDWRVRVVAAMTGACDDRLSEDSHPAVRKAYSNLANDLKTLTSKDDYIEEEVSYMAAS